MTFTTSEVRAYYASRVPSLKMPRGAREFRGLCPVHNGKDPNFAVNAETGLAQCHSQCGRGFDLISLEQELSGLDFIRAKERVFELVGRPKVPWEERNVEAIYEYTDEEGRPLYQVLRYFGKEFKQRRPDGNGGWHWGLGDAQRVPFHLPQVIAAETVAVCYSADTELLTARGWVPFPELTHVDRVAQFAAEDQVSFVETSDIQSFDFDGDICHFEADWCDMMVTPDHRVLSRLKRRANGKHHWCEPVVTAASAIVTSRYYPVAGVLGKSCEGGGPGVDAARLIVAWCADGVNEQRGSKISWNFKKSRKKDRLLQLLTASGIASTEHVYDSTPGWTSYRVGRDELTGILQWCPAKHIPFEAVWWPLADRVALLEEIGYWDGDFTGREGVRFFTVNKCEADAVAAIAAVTGWGCVVRADNRESRPEQRTQYVLNLVPRQWRQAASPPTRKPYSGKVYCCTVPSGFLVTRRGGKTTVSGNCEGEKDVLTLDRIELTGTCNNGGGGNFLPETAKYFAGKHVIIFPDNDDPGRSHALKVAALLSPVAKSVKIIELPDIPLKGDVTDFVNAGGTIDTIRRLYRSAQQWTPEWEFASILPNENDRFVRSFEDEIIAAGGHQEFWNLSKLAGMETPWLKLSRALGGGMRRGEVYVIGANQGAGKTSLVLQFAIAAMRRLNGVLVFSMEMDWRAIFQRMAAIEAHVNLNELRSVQITQRMKDATAESKIAARATESELVAKLLKSAHELVKYSLLVSTKSSVTPEYIIKETNRLKERAKVELVIVDHMQLMGSTGTVRGEYEKFTAISRAMKTTAVDIDVPLLLVSQTSRSQTRERRGELEVADLRGSGAIEEDAAGVLLLYEDAADRAAALAEGDGSRYTRGPVKCFLKLGKNRYGEQGRCFELLHYKTSTRFELSEDVC